MPGHEAGNEVWSSTDGAEWQQATRACRLESAAGCCVVSFKDKMWMLGGTEDYYFGDAQA